MATDTIITYEASSEYIQNEGRPEIKLKIATSNSMYIIHSALVKQLATKRQGTAHSLVVKLEEEVENHGSKKEQVKRELDLLDLRYGKVEE